MRRTLAKLLLLWTVALLLAFLTIGHSMATAATLSRDINSYVLFGLESLSVKGRNVQTDRGFILGGNVGVNRQEPNTNNWLMSLGANGYLEMGNNTQVVADSLRADEANVYDLFVNRLNSNSPATLRGSQSTFTPPIIASLPALPFTPNRTSTNNAADVQVLTGQNVTLTANTAYGALDVNDNAVLNLTDGLYDFRNFNIGKGVTVNVTDNTFLQIDQGFFLNEGSTFGVGTSAGAQIYVGADGLTGANDVAANLGRGGRNAQQTIYAQLYSPNGDFNMGNHSNHYGRFWARNISDDWNTNATYMNPVPIPGAVWLLGSGLMGLVAVRRKAKG